MQSVLVNALLQSAHVITSRLKTIRFLTPLCTSHMYIPSPAPGLALVVQCSVGRRCQCVVTCGCCGLRGGLELLKAGILSIQVTSAWTSG